MNTEVDEIETQIKINKVNQIRTGFVLIIPSIIMFILSLFFEDVDTLFITLTETVCASFAASLPIITFLKKDEKENMFYKYIGIGFFFISLLAFSKAIILNRIAQDWGIEIITILNLINCYLEYILVLIAFHLTLFKSSLKVSIKINFFVSAIFLCLAVIVFKNNITDKFFLITEYSLLVFVVLTIIMVLNKNSEILSKNERNILFRYILFITLHQFFYFLYINGNTSWIYLSGFFKYLAYYTVYELTSKYVLYNSYLKIKKELESAQNVQKELNTILIGRNKTLVEMENIIDKGRKRYGQLIESIADGIIIFYFDKIYYINKEALNIVGYNDYTELIDMKFNSFIENVLDEKVILKDSTDIRSLIEGLESGKEKGIKVDLSSIDGTDYEMYIMNVDSFNKFIYIKNVNEINKNQEFKLRYNEYLKGETVKTEFYSNISHELRTPINLIYSAIQLSEINTNDNNMESIEKNNETIKHNCLRLIRTINNFIDTNRISEGYLVPNLKIYNIVSIVENIALASNKYIEQINNSLIFDSEEEEFFVNCDKDIMERVILNILSNSIKFGKSGGNIAINIYSNLDEIIIVIMNNGYIVDDEAKPFLFDKFTKINKSLNRKKEGSGLGLYLTRELLYLQEGTITLESDASRGTEFLITLPRSYDGENSEIEEDFEKNPVEHKVDIEFSDIYL
jgi:signal transduction histidine kinase